MSIIGIWDTRELDKFAEKLNRISQKDLQKFNEDAVKQIAAMALAKMIARTPVGEYHKDGLVEFTTKDGEEVSFIAKPNIGKMGGTLRRGWTNGKIDVGKDEEVNVADAYVYIVNNIEVVKKGRTYFIVLSNPVHYASYVEYGHRTRDHKGWVEGSFMMKLSEDEINEELPAILEGKLEKFLGEYFNE